MRVVPATADSGVDEQHGGRQISEKCLHGNLSLPQRSIIPLIEQGVNPTCVKGGRIGPSLQGFSVLAAYSPAPPLAE